MSAGRCRAWDELYAILAIILIGLAVLIFLGVSFGIGFGLGIWVVA